MMVMGTSGWPHAAMIVGVECSDELRSEVKGGDARFQRTETDVLVEEGATDEAQPALPFDRAGPTNAPHFPARRIEQGGQLWPKGSGTGAVKASGRFLAERFVRALVVVIAPPPMPARLLLARGGGGQAHGVGFELTVHLLVGPVVLRTSRPNELDFDPQAQPPEAEARESQRAFAAKGRAVVYPDDWGRP